MAMSDPAEQKHNGQFPRTSIPSAPSLLSTQEPVESAERPRERQTIGCRPQFSCGAATREYLGY